jgi:diguanylate cyclase (GGDEF)-like protein
MNNINALLNLVRRNEEIARKFHEIETRILSILNFTDLFEVLLAEIIEKFRVPHVWISLIDSGEVPHLIEVLGNSDALKSRMNIIDRNTFNRLVPEVAPPLLVNRNLERFSIFFPQDLHLRIGSLAIAPISLDGAVIGCLNQADLTTQRFCPGIDTTLLERLALKVSLCLANVTAHEKLAYLAYHDPLTGLLNRRVMDSILRREYIRAIRYGSPLTLVFIDLNKFKVINDTLGHQAGDELLCHTAGFLMQQVRGSDVVARFAGDEFVILLPETGPEMAQSLMDRIQTLLRENPFTIKGCRVRASLSYGLATSGEAMVRSPACLLRLADKRLYEMKAALATVQQGES